LLGKGSAVPGVVLRARLRELHATALATAIEAIEAIEAIDRRHE
jgi:hypothetical protein